MKMGDRKISLNSDRQPMEETLYSLSGPQVGDDYVRTSLFSEYQLLDQALEGMVLANSGLVRIAGQNILLRRDYLLSQNKNKVRLLSGGWSGHEPMYTGFVGEGMLTGAVIGEKNVPPPYPVILTAIRELGIDHPNGVLLILINHPIIKLNFSLAVDCALREGINVKVVYVSDDTSGEPVLTGRRGLCGIAFLFKVAGAMADLGIPLEEIHSVCSQLSTTDISSVNVNIRVDDKYRSEDTSLIAESNSNINCEECMDKTVEVQSEVPGVPACRYPFISIQELATTLLGYIIDASLSPYSVVVEPDTPVALLFNNFGYMMNVEVLAIVNQVVKEMYKRNIAVARVYIGSVMTDVINKGFSICVMKLADKENMLQYLDYPTDVSGWPRMVQIDPPEENETFPVAIPTRFPFLEVEPKELGPILSEEQGKTVFTVLEYVAMAVSNCEAQINKIGLGNNIQSYGSIMKFGVETLRNRLFANQIRTRRPFQFLQQLSYIASYMPSICGAHYSIFFEAASHPFARYLSSTEVTYSMWTDSLEAGIKGIEHFAKIQRGERTLLDALYPALEEMKKIPESFAKIAEAAETGSFKTVYKCKRQNYLPDPGSHTVAIWMRAAVEALNAVNKGAHPMMFGSFDASSYSINDSNLVI